MNGFTNRKSLYRKSLSTLTICVLATVLIFAVNRFMYGEEHKEVKVVSHGEILGQSELSGMSVEVSKSEASVYTIGDGAPAIAHFKLNISSTDDFKGAAVFKDFGEDILKKKATCSQFTSQECKLQKSMLTEDWEGLTSDSRYHFALQEFSNSITVVRKDSKAVLATLKLLLPESSGDKSAHKFKKVRNVEGVILLKNGHIAVTKEANPASVYELSPVKPEKGKDKTLGISKHTVLAEGEAFQFPKDVSLSEDLISTIQYYPIAQWFLHSGEKCDFADFGFSKNLNSLVVLSQTCSSLLFFKPLNPKVDSLEILRQVEMPQEIKSPEALGLIDSETYLIGSDRKKGDNLYLIRVRPAKQLEIED